MMHPPETTASAPCFDRVENSPDGFRMAFTSIPLAPGIIRRWNGYGEQMTAVFLPNPRLTGKRQLLKQPDRSRLELDYRQRAEFLGEAVPADYEAAAHMPIPAVAANQAG